MRCRSRSASATSAPSRSRHEDGVVAGELGGRRLVAPRGWRVRPTSDRVREAIFSSSATSQGAGVLDLYCGTGALGDRGALARRGARRPCRPRRPAARSATSQPRAAGAGRARPRRRDRCAWRRARHGDASTSSSSTPRIDSPTALGPSSTAIFPAACRGRPRGRRERRPPARCDSRCRCLRERRYGDTLSPSTAPSAG